MGRNVNNIVIGNDFLGRTPKQQIPKKSPLQTNGLHQTTTFLYIKGHDQQNEKTEWEKMLSNHGSTKGFISQIDKKSCKSVTIQQQ